VTVNANDVAVMGVRPRWFLATVLLPPGTPEGEVSALFDALGAALHDVGAALVGGHTEITPAVTKPVVVGQMLGCTTGRVITTGGARAGEVVVQVGPVPIEGAAVLAGRATGLIDDDTLVAAARAFDDPGTSVVVPALAAAGLGATSLHDPTEGGLAGALHELATAAGTRIRVDTAAVLWFAPGVAICAALGADPWRTLASGAVLATFPADRAAAAIGELRATGHPAAAIGVVEAGTGVVDASGAAIACPARDEVARLLETE
jgi:hydrogenase expression/formation protein HypE